MRPIGWLIVATLAAAGPADDAFAQTLLRWKLKAGESLVVEVQQQTTSQVAFSGKSAKSTIELGMELEWSVTAANEKAITIKQSVRRITFELDSPQAGHVKYDSADKARPTGQARSIAEAVQPLLGAQVQIEMTARGVVLSAEPANDAAQKLVAADVAADQPGVFSKAALAKLLRQPLAVLPEQAVAVGDTWTATSDLAAAAGSFKQTTTYKLADPVDREGQTLQRIEVTAKLEPVAAATPTTSGAPPPKLTLKSHEQAGTIYFSAEAGRLVSADETQKLTTERPYRETTIVVSLTSTQKTAIAPK